jgi:hypothetical protein
MAGHGLSAGGLYLPALGGAINRMDELGLTQDRLLRRKSRRRPFGAGFGASSGISA